MLKRRKNNCSETKEKEVRMSEDINKIVVGVWETDKEQNIKIIQHKVAGQK